MRQTTACRARCARTCTTPRSTQPRRRAPARRSGRSVARNGAGCQGVGDAAAAPAVEGRPAHLQLVLERLLIEEFPGGHRHEARAHAVQPRRGGDAQLHFRAGGDDHELRVVGARRPEDVRDAAHRFGRRAREVGHALARERQDRRRACGAECEAMGSGAGARWESGEASTSSAYRGSRERACTSPTPRSRLRGAA